MDLRETYFEQPRRDAIFKSGKETLQLSERILLSRYCSLLQGNSFMLSVLIQIQCPRLEFHSERKWFFQCFASPLLVTHHQPL